jgi:hypothetical protein
MVYSARCAVNSIPYAAVDARQATATQIARSGWSRQLLIMSPRTQNPMPKIIITYATPTHSSLRNHRKLPDKIAGPADFAYPKV